MFKILIFLLFYFSQTYANNINIAVAANVSYAIGDLIKEFNKANPNIKIRTTLGSSGKLTAQIRNRANYDILLSANMKYPDFLYKNDIALNKPIVYAKGSLSIFSIHQLDCSKGLGLLKQQNISKIAISNPKTAPYGKASIEALKNNNIYNNIKSKFVFASSASTTMV